MDTSSKIMLGIIAILGMSAIGLSQNEVLATPLNDFLIVLDVFIEVQSDIISQNDEIITQNYIMIEQNDIMIQLLKGNSNIFVPQLTDRYDIMEYRSNGECVFYDRLEKDVKSETCPIVGLTKDQFNSMLAGNPQN